MFLNFHRSSYFTIALLILSGPFVQIVSQDLGALGALPNLVGEVVRTHIQDVGIGLLQDFSKAALINGAMGLLRGGNPAPAVSPAPGSPQTGGVRIPDPAPNNLPFLLPLLQKIIPHNAEDPSADPQKHVVQVRLQESCQGQTADDPQIEEIKEFDPYNSQIPIDKMCVPLVVCNAYNEDTAQRNYCVIPGSLKSIGFCCVTANILPPGGSIEQGPRSYATTLNSRAIKPISKRFQSTLMDATRKSIQIVKSLYSLQEFWIRSGNVDIAEMPVLDQVIPDARDIADGALGLVETTRAIATKLTGTTSLVKQVPAASVLSTKTGQVFCPSSLLPSHSCQNANHELTNSNSTIYRTIDGSCNNLEDPTIGQKFQPLIRLTQSAYEDGIYSARKLSRNGKSQLPSARKVSEFVISGESYPSASFNFGYASFGQFIAYDMSHTASYDMGFDTANSEKSGENDHHQHGANRIRCCSQYGKALDVNQTHPLCDPIEISTSDEFYSSFGATCMPFVRSMISSMSCSLGAAQQMNQATDWLDLSQVYGSSEKALSPLRSFEGGRLKVAEFRKEDYLILNKKECGTNAVDGKCAFQTGNPKGNYQMYLTIFHTLWRREHNRIAATLLNTHSEWSDEKIFQESRRIAVAEYQHILYNEFVPQLVGMQLLQRFHLKPKYQGNTEYNSKIDASITNEFATAAFRIGITMMPDMMKIVSNHKDVTKFPLSDSIEKPLRLMGDGIQDGAIRGMTRMPMKAVSPSVSKALTDKLFKPMSKFYGMDLVALTIQRGREHGLLGYADVVNSISEYCGVFPIPAIQSFSDMVALVGVTNVEKLKSVYESYLDVDLFIGGVMEVPLAGGQIGPTFGCIISDQFSRSKYGDRFYFEHGNLQHSFTNEQLQEIRSSSSSRIFCDNAKDIQEMQPLGLRQVADGNPLIPCANFYSIPRVNLQVWQ